jgi:hypothetical protein
MGNVIAVLRGLKVVAFFFTQDDAEMYINLMKAQFGHLDILWQTEIRYMEITPYIA